MNESSSKPAHLSCFLVLTESREMRLVLIGMTGAGKSSTGNSILCANENRSPPFKTSCQSSTLTLCSTSARELVLGRSIAVVDTPGFLDTNFPVEKTITEIEKCVFLLSPGLHAILLVVRIGRLTAEVLKAVSSAQEVFGKESINYMILVFTGYDSLRRDGISLEEYVADLEGEMKTLIEMCNNRYIAIDNTLDPVSSENIQQIESLLKMVENVVSVNSGNCYTNEMLKEAHELMEQERERILSKIKSQETKLETRRQKLLDMEERLKQLADTCDGEEKKHLPGKNEGENELALATEEYDKEKIAAETFESEIQDLRETYEENNKLIAECTRRRVDVGVEFSFHDIIATKVNCKVM